MSNTISESQSSNNQNLSLNEDSKQQINANDDYTQRQLQSSFQPTTVTFVFFCLKISFSFV
jgi:hypothetical protein